MRYALVGVGRMGRAIDTEAARRGHQKVAEIDTETGPTLDAPEFDPAALARADVAFEFTAPAAAAANVMALLSRGVAVVCGTTGWEPDRRFDEAARAAGVGAIVAPNFSVGVNLYVRLVREAGRMFGRAGLHRPYVLEAHHVGKQDAPSGTARLLASSLLEVDPALNGVHEGNPPGRLPDGVVHVASLRAGSEPGTHTVGFDGEYDCITLTHRARSRAGFAIGAVLAAEWVRGRSGLHRFDEVVEALLDERQSPNRIE